MLDYNYEYITDPPFLVDIGEQKIALQNFSILFDSETVKDPASGDFYFNLTKLQLSDNSILFDMDGVSDFSIVLSGIIKTVFGLIESKIQYLIGSALQDKLVPLINKIILSIPADIPIPGTHLHLDLEFANEPESTVAYGGFLLLPISISIKSDDFPDFPHPDPAPITNDDNVEHY